MRKGFYIYPNNSLVIELFKLRYKSSDYEKWHIRYYSYPRMEFLIEQKNVKLYLDKIKHWTRYDFI